MLCALLLVASVLLGGGTRGGFFSDVVLQLIAIPIFLAAGWKAIDNRLTLTHQLAIAFCLSLLALPLLQLVPLPVSSWTALPNRGEVAAGFELVGIPLSWMPLSVAPAATWLSALSLLPPIAMFIGTVLLDWRERRGLSLLLITLAILSVFLGLLQVAQGENSPLRFFAFTNWTEAVGFFANRNHFAALVYAAMLFAAAWVVQLAVTTGSRLRDYDPVAVIMLIVAFIAVVVLVAGQTMARSRAGLGLTIIGLFGTCALAASDRRARGGVTPMRLLTGAVVLAVVFSAQYALSRIFERFEADPLEDARVIFARNTLSAARAYLPFGSGIGSFVAVYGQLEKPADALAYAYANHAHNDFAELWLETGIFGPLMMAGFLIFLVARSIKVWRTSPADDVAAIDRLLARSATMVIALLLAHSFVDYPLRTGAMMAVMAFACALLIDPPIRGRAPGRVGLRASDPVAATSHGRAAVPLSATEPGRTAPPPGRNAGGATAPNPARAQARKPSVDPLAPPLPNEGRAPMRAAKERWGRDIEWPEAWRSPASPRSPSASRKRDEN